MSEQRGEQRESMGERRGSTIDEMGFSRGAKRRHLSQAAVTYCPKLWTLIYNYTRPESFAYHASAFGLDMIHLSVRKSEDRQTVSQMATAAIIILTEIEIEI